MENNEPLTEAQRIEKEAEQKADNLERRGCSAHHGYRVGYIAGATAERERITKRLDEIIFDIKADIRSYSLTSHTETLFKALKELESLKSDSK